MKTFKLVLIALVVTLLGGCAVYGPPAAYNQPYYQTAPEYGQPAYVVQQPVYVQPSVQFGFGYWGGGGRRHGGHHHH